MSQTATRYRCDSSIRCDEPPNVHSEGRAPLLRASLSTVLLADSLISDTRSICFPILRKTMNTAPAEVNIRTTSYAREDVSHRNVPLSSAKTGFRKNVEAAPYKGERSKRDG